MPTAMDLSRQTGLGKGREPCPARIVDDVGLSFAAGLVGGGAWHFLRGLKNSPRGSRLIHAAQTVRMEVPRTAGTFAVWGGTFAAGECGLYYSRQKEDPWNSIISGAATSGLLQMRRGFLRASGTALVGGATVTLMEGFMILFFKHCPALLPEAQRLGKDPNAIPAGFGTSQFPPIKVPENDWIPLEDEAEMKSAICTGAMEKTEVLDSSFDAANFGVQVKFSDA